jgi:hypothetical protein
VRTVMIVNEVLHDLLGHVQTLAILLAALIAADFFVFTPTVTSTVVQEYRVDTSVVTDAYTAAGTQAPPVVLSTLGDLSNRSIPIGQSATVVNSGASSSASGQAGPATSGASAPPAPASDVYPMAEICAKSRATVEAVFAGACTVGLQQNLPLYDRALFHFDEEAGSPLDAGQLHDAIARLTMAVFARATITMSNSGKSTAQNVNIIVPDGYSRKSGTLPLSLSAGEKSDVRFESRPGALASTQGAIVTNPAFTVKWDPTGPLDPHVSLQVVLGCIVLLILLAVLDAIQAIASGGQRQPASGPTA